MQFLRVAIVLLALAVPIDGAFAQNRVALVVGNGAYSREIGSLNNPTNDADLVSAALMKAGFETTVLKNAGRGQLQQKIDEFGIALSNAGNDSIGFFYYSGHGAARPGDGTNYLIPVDVLSLQKQSAWYDAISLDWVVREVTRRAPNAALFFIFDACRTELRLPIKSASKGFEEIAARDGTFIAFSTSPGQTASDEGEKGGPYARALSAELLTPNQDYSTIFRRVKQAVYKFTHRVQRPWEHDGLIEAIILNDSRTASYPPPPPIEAQQSQQPKQIALTGKQIENVIAAQKDMDAITDKIPDNAPPDPRADAKLDEVAKRYGFADYRDYNTVVDNITLVLSGIDPITEKYVGTEAVIKASIAQVQADKKMSPNDKKEALDDLNAALKKQAPDIQNKGNIDLVIKYHDKLKQAFAEEDDQPPALTPVRPPPPPPRPPTK